MTACSPTTFTAAKAKTSTPPRLLARGEDAPDSDVDFLVDFPEGYDMFAQRLPLARKLAELTGRSVDPIPEHELSAHIRERVLRDPRMRRQAGA
jgi:predicted nucleotidyltransferase